MKSNYVFKATHYPWCTINPTQYGHFNALASVEQIESAFEDSTNELWRLVFEDRRQAVLKVCALNGVKGSCFWDGMTSLFGFDYPQSMGLYSPVYERIDALSDLAIPELVVCESATIEHAGFLFCSMLPGQTLTGPITDAMVEQLAVHLASLHADLSPVFGSFFNSQNSAESWWPKVIKTVKTLAKAQGVALNSLDLEGNYQNQHPCFEGFVPIMIDLRWDQFLTDSENLTGLVDLDAFVYADRALEFVILEYLLTEQQAETFKTVYLRNQTIPGLTLCRPIYRQLLFLMNILGEKSLDTWMQAPQRF